MAKLHSQTTDVTGELATYLERRIYALQLPGPNMLLRHRPPSVVALEKWMAVHDPTRKIIRSYENGSANAIDPQFQHCITIQFKLNRDQFPFGVVLQSTKDPDTPTLEITESTVWPLIEEKIRQAWSWQREGAAARHVAHRVISACRGPRDFAAVWPVLYNLSVERGWLSTKPLTTVPTKYKGAWENRLDPTWRAMINRIDGWITQCRMLDLSGSNSPLSVHSSPRVPKELEDMLPPSIWKKNS